MIRLVIPGRPVPAARMTQRGKYLGDHAQRYLTYKTEVGWRAQVARLPMLAGPVLFVARVCLHGEAGGDWDNYGKALSDGLNGIAWRDDKQVEFG